MTIRHLIQRAKLQLIQKQYDHLFVFHCSGLTHSQWRQLKHLLYSKRANFLFGASHFTGLSDNHIATKHNTFGPTCLLYVIDPNNRSSNCSPYQEEWTKRQELALSYLYRDLCHFRDTNDSQLEISKGISTGPKNLTEMRKGNTTQGKRARWPNVLHQVEISAYNTNLVLLSAQIQLISMNHADIKHATHLQDANVFNLFIPSINDPIQEFYFCLSQPFLYLLWYNSLQYDAASSEKISHD